MPAPIRIRAHARAQARCLRWVLSPWPHPVAKWGAYVGRGPHSENNIRYRQQLSLRQASCRTVERWPFTLFCVASAAEFTAGMAFGCMSRPVFTVDLWLYAELFDGIVETWIGTVLDQLVGHALTQGVRIDDADGRIDLRGLRFLVGDVRLLGITQLPQRIPLVVDVGVFLPSALRIRMLSSVTIRSAT